MGKAKAEKKDSKKSKTVEQEVDYKALYKETVLELNAEARNNEALGQALEASVETMVKATSDASLMAKTIQENLSRIEFHCKMIKEKTGELLAEDVTYAVNMARRVLDYALNQESED